MIYKSKFNIMGLCVAVLMAVGLMAGCEKNNRNDRPCPCEPVHQADGTVIMVCPVHGQQTPATAPLPPTYTAPTPSTGAPVPVPAPNAPGRPTTVTEPTPPVVPVPSVPVTPGPPSTLNPIEEAICATMVDYLSEKRDITAREARKDLPTIAGRPEFGFLTAAALQVIRDKSDPAVLNMADIDGMIRALKTAKR